MGGKTKQFLAIDLFCGCGGLTVGLNKAGFKVVGAIDNEKLAIETYKANHPKVKLYFEDITKISPHTLLKDLGLKKGSLDLIAGCPPCQGFSAIRTLNGARVVDDPRNNLLWTFFAFIDACLPRAVMLENVPGLSKDIRFRKFLTRMEKLGYRGDFRILNAAEYGVPQRRKRLIYLAGRETEIPFAKPYKKRPSVWQAIGGLPPVGMSGDGLHDLPEKRTPKVMKIIKKIPKDGGSRTALPEENQLECHKRCNGFRDVYGRMSWNDIAPTITSGCFNPSKGRFLHPEENRAITMREASLLQGFPKKYKFPNVRSKTSIALMIGNALPPPFIKAHAKEILKILK